MSNFQLAGIVLFMIGLVPWTVGGFIHLARHPKSWDLFLTTQLPKSSAVEAVRRSMFTDPKSRWWCLIGVTACLTGFVLLVFASFGLGFVAPFVALAAALFGWIRVVGGKRR